MDALDGAAALIGSADAFLFTAGAGMGVDAGLATFRGPEKSLHPVHARIGYETLSSAKLLRDRPAVAWGFHARARQNFQAHEPHDGYSILRRWTERTSEGAWVFTSNVDEHFRRSGFDARRIVEVHGSLANLQCMRWCGVGLVPAEGIAVPVDPETLEATALPECPKCGALLRPNVCLFADGEWDDTAEVAAYTALEDWIDAMADRGKRIAIIECGAGTTIPTVRQFGERIDRLLGGGRLVRINRHEPSVPAGSFGIALGCLEGLAAIDARVP